MSEKISLDSTNLSITEDAFEQFQVNSMYEEEEFITLSDIVSPERAAPELPSDIGEIPYDNEVVLSANDDPNSVSLPGTTKPDQTDSANVSVLENNVITEQAPEPIPEQNNQGRSKRVRKKKSYVDDFVTDPYEKDNIQSKSKENKKKSITPTKSRRGRKPKQNEAQNEIIKSENSSHENPVEQIPKPTKRGRKKASEVSLMENSKPETNKKDTSEDEFPLTMNQDFATEISDSTKNKNAKCKQKCRKKTSKTMSEDSSAEAPITPSVPKSDSSFMNSHEENSSNIEQQGNGENNIPDELVSGTLTETMSKLTTLSEKNSPPRKSAGRRGRPKKTSVEPQLLENNDISQHPSDNGLEKTNLISNVNKKPGKRGRRKKITKEKPLETNDNVNVSDAEDELDNVSLKTLSERNGDAAAKLVDVESKTSLQPSESDEIDIGDNIALSELKENLDVANTEVQDMELDETVDTIHSEINVNVAENVPNNAEICVKEETIENENDSLLQEDESKRPTRRRAKKVMHYDEGSDEDPFANVELSDDEGVGKKGRYYSDDEYIPGSENKKKGNRGRTSITSEDDSDISEIEEDLEDFQKGKRKRLFSANRSSRGKKSKLDIKETTDVNVTTIAPKVEDDADDIEVCLQSSVIQANDATKKPSSVYTDEFENFIAKKIQGTNIKIKKVSPDQSSQSAPLEIPVLDPDAKKTVEISVQTNLVKTTSSGVQTDIQHEVAMKDNVTLTADQSEKACEFLKSIVKTTSELGQLMTEKSEDFIAKKINTKHVTDTFKMDYCVKKSFLLLKLAKHNIVQMEDDLSKQYEEFLKRTNLISHREQEKTIKPTEKDSDSDCEIVEDSQLPIPTKKEKSKFNPKTVFLNKELSIKIAKKPASKTVADKCKETLNIKNKNSVWISDTVMVKKVKPTQSFLAQDSRNKKPPDNFVTEKMVSDFFDSYYQKHASSICAPFTSTTWLNTRRNYVCNYFVVKSDNISDASTSIPSVGETHIESIDSDAAASISNINNSKEKNMHKTANPVTLISLCTEVLKKHMKLSHCHTLQKIDHEISCKASDPIQIQTPCTLSRLCVNVISENILSYNISPNSNNCYGTEENEAFLDFNSKTAFPDIATQVHFGVPDVEKSEAPLETESKSVTDIENSEAWLGVSLQENMYDEEIKAKPNDKAVILETLKTLCFIRVKQMFTVPLQTTQDSKDIDDALSEVSFVLSDSGSCDLSVSNYRLDDMLADFDSVFKNDVESLFSLCVKKIQESQKVHIKKVMDLQGNAVLQQDYCIVKDDNANNIEGMPNSLKHLTFVTIKNMMYATLDQPDNICHNKNTSEVDVLRYKVKKLADICFEIVSAYTADNSDQGEKMNVGMTINCVNTLSEEAFHNMEEENYEDDGENFYDDNNYESEFNHFEDQDEDTNWETQVQLQEFKPCLENNKQSNASQETEEQTTAENSNPLEEQAIPAAQIKLEPLDEPLETVIDSTFIKTEPMQHNEMTIIPESIITKQERTESADDHRERVPLQRQNSSSFDVDTFEDFVRRNKMMHALDEPNDDAYPHSHPRVKRQHEPDYMNEYDPSLNLLVPQTFEPLSVENAKGVLMASSSDEESSNQKTTAKKKTDKRGKGRQKKSETKQNKDVLSSKQNQEVANSKQSKEIANTKPPKEPPPVKGKVALTPPVNEVAMLTRRMREKIRQEEKKVESSDSEGDSVPVTTKKGKDRKENDRKENDKTKTSKSNKEKPVDNEIQCSNVDSTEQIEQNDDTDKNFTGFSTVDQNEITSYQKYVKFVYDKILPKHTELDSNIHNVIQNENPQDRPCFSSNENENDGRSESPLINYDEPTEMLECEPTMPIFDDSVQDVKQQKRSRPKSKAVKDKECIKAQENLTETEVVKEKEPNIKDGKPGYTERNGWQCYPISPNDTKLYQTPVLFLEKLPETFVQTYFEYQQIAHNQDEDKEVDRLINLNTLSRSSVKEIRKLKEKGRVTKDGHSGKTADTSRAATPTSDGCAELTASEDEGANVDDEIPPPAPSKHANENSLAKNSLMDDSDSDDTAKIKEEPKDEVQSEGPKPKSKKKLKGKATKENQQPLKLENPDSLMLTADKMMNKELNLLHAPVVLSNDISKTSDKGSPNKNRPKRGSRGNSSRDHTKNDEDSSSEEEKQWVTTKEKLLKRMGKKSTTSADDAKRAKLVSEFIERRGVAADTRKSRRGRGRRRCSRKMLEREKQMRVLSHELFGTPADPALMGTRHAQFSQSFFKGRRNIRKVIDKKSLARSTVIANMEEFERKCRLNQRQAQLRELLGCEEGVNVLVINDEVCLEYGFEEQCPLVTVHPFFTKVMKAHQYEGVKFMWDACFESLEKVESGHPGGGCILAHCMGLGKTLQVLALLHTVLTHPRVGMQRVLVCCPLSTVLNWVDEIHKWIGPVTDQIKVFELSKLKKTYERAYQLEDWYSGGGIFIIGYELFRSLTTLDAELDDIRPTIVNKIRTALLDPGPDIIVCDEGHLLKNDCSVLAVAMSRVVTKRRIVLTGTPMQNNLREYYCMVNFIKPNLLGTYSEYSNRFENPIMNGQHRDSQEEDIKLMKQRTHILHKVLEGCLQRQEASVLYPYLPKKHEYTVFISLTKVQWDLYKHYINNYSTNNTKQSILKDFHVLQKIWSHPQVLHNFQTKKRDDSEVAKIKPEKLEDDLAHEDLTSEVLKSEDVKPAEAWWLQYLDGGNMLDSLECSNKFVVVFKILDECIALGDKVLIFSTSLFTMDALEYFLQNINKWSLGQEYYRLDGSVPAEVRQKWCREFNAEHNLKTKLFLISTRAGSLGLNMVAANRVIILDTSWNPAHDIQSIFRVYRFGQKKDCYIYRLVALGTMEQKIYERSVTKQAVACRVVDEQQIDRHYNMAELTELYKYDELGVSVAGGVAVGVTDIALLRVARLPALHAVHEHDSLLRGSSEQQLPEHERNAAWMQFQQEHAHKQMQNQLTSSFSLHLPTPFTPPGVAPPMHTYQQLINDPNLQPADVKPEHNLLVPYQPQPKPKTKKGKKKKVIVEIPTAEEPPADPQAEAIQEEMSQKIMNILIKNDFQNRQTPREIADLVSTVRKIVAYGKVPPGSFNNDVAMEIANVLLMKEPAASRAPTPQQEIPSQPPPVKKTRGRPRKQSFPESSFSSKPPTPQPVETPSQPSTSKSDFNVYTPGRRRAAINAERQIDSLKESVAGEEAGYGDLGDADWQNDSGPEEIVPESKPKKKSGKAAAPVTVKTENIRELTQDDSILLLSDDDEPPPKQTKKSDTKKPTQKKTTASKTEVSSKTETKKSESQEEVVPLHPSLLSNKNFIKIVAHTYLQGNPMLDEDAAMLAAQYSTLKAKKEIEATGQPITNGPIYDIAAQVLGINILKKLHKANPNVVGTGETSQQEEEPPQVKKEPGSESKQPTAETRRPGPRLKAKLIGELTGNTPPAATPAAPSVVPVGFINSAGATPSVVPVAAPQQPVRAAREESILPDDDDVILGDQPATNNIFKRNAKPLVLNSVIATPKPAPQPAPTPAAPSQPRIPKLVISAGKLLPARGFTTTMPPQAAPAPPPPAAKPSTIQNDTICLDSDEETITNEPAPKPKKRVAVKSTARPQVTPAPQPAPAPVPVSISAANPQLNAMFQQHHQVTGTQLETMLNMPQAPFTTPNYNQKYSAPQVPQAQLAGGNIVLNAAQSASGNPGPGSKYVVLPASQVQNLNRLPSGFRPQLSTQSFAPQQTPTYMRTPLLQNTMMQQVPPAPAPLQRAAAPESILPTVRVLAPAMANKTVCKPGDILRITKTGQIEVLNREVDDDVAIVDDDNVAPPNQASVDQAKAPEPTRTRGRPSASTQRTATPPPPQPSKTKQPSEKTKKPDRTRIVSSSSSSDSSRPSTPDPLSILKDVVHIKAPEEDSPQIPKSASTTSMVGNTSITKSAGTPLKTYSNEPAKPQKSVKSSTPSKNVTQDDIMKHISKTDTILKKLDKALIPGKIQTTQQKASSAANKSKPAGPPPKTVATIDLDSYEQPARSATSKLSTIPSQAASSSKTRITQSTSSAKPAPKKIVGTSKDIIISVSGKSKSLTSASSANKATTRVATADKAAPSTSTGKKRSAVTDSGPQKKKSAPMTLKDFNIDDIDDIIELD